MTSHIFAQPPTGAQMEALHMELARRHDRPGMEMRVRPVPLLGPDEVPQFESRGGDSGDAAGLADVAMFTVCGKGRIE